MSFFKSGKYKLGGGSSKSKHSHEVKVPSAKEHFQVITASPKASHKATKGKAPPKPNDASANSDSRPRFRLQNKTEFDWKLDSGNKDVFPEEVTAGGSKSVVLGKEQDPAQAVYYINITKDNGETESHEFQVTLAKNDKTHELIVDWKNLTDVDGIRFKPDSSSSNKPLKLDNKEVLVEIDIGP